MSKQEDKKVVTGQTDLGDGANSPIDDSNKKQLGHSAPGEEGKGAKTDAEQRKRTSMISVITGDREIDR